VGVGVMMWLRHREGAVQIQGSREYWLSLGRSEAESQPPEAKGAGKNV